MKWPNFSEGVSLPVEVHISRPEAIKWYEWQTSQQLTDGLNQQSKARDGSAQENLAAKALTRLGRKWVRTWWV